MQRATGVCTASCRAGKSQMQTLSKGIFGPLPRVKPPLPEYLDLLGCTLTYISNLTCTSPTGPRKADQGLEVGDRILAETTPFPALIHHSPHPIHCPILPASASCLFDLLVLHSFLSHWRAAALSLQWQPRHTE